MKKNKLNMKKNFFTSALFLLIAVSGHAQDEYYFSGKKLNPDIPTPESFFGFRIGHSLVRYDKVVEYFKLLADKSDRASIEVFGLSYEGREQVALIVSSPENQRNLENIRTEHLKVVDPAASIDLKSQKAIVYLGYNVHGGEIAGTDASVVAAYYLVASEDEDIINRLKETVVLVEPSLNPDGRDRATTFINGFNSVVPVADPADRTHSGGFVPHRGNHYFCDLNRDWLPLSQPESRNRVNFYHKWYPNIYLDFHEMGSSSSYYFEPSPKPTWSPSIPQETYEVLNNILARHFSQALNHIGSLYYTKEDFTNYSPIYGSTYPDFEGGVGTTLEVGSTSGIQIETEYGIRTFSQNVRDNFEISIAAVRAATDEKETFLNHQKNFFKSALTQADKETEKYIVFGSKEDKSLNILFINYLLTHRIEVYELKSAFSQDGKKFEPGSAYIIPYHQPHFRILNSIFEETTKYATSAFMDISAPSTAQGFGIQYAKVKGSVGEGAKITKAPEVKGSIEARSDYAYVFDTYDYLSPKAVYYLQDNDVKIRLAQKEFTAQTKVGEKSFAPGSIVIPVRYQTVSPDKLYQLLNEAAALANINISAIDNGLSVAGIDIGSNNIRAVKKPVIATVTGGSGYGGGNWTSIGELWSLLSDRHHIPLSKIDYQVFERADLSDYTSIVLTGIVPFTPAFITRLTDWIERGGTLIATGTATQWAATSGIATGLVTDTTHNRRNANADAPERNVVRRTADADAFRSGAILKGELNLSSPLAYGLTSKEFYVLKTNSTGVPSPINANNIVLSTGTAEIVHGHVPDEIAPKLKNLPVVVAVARGQGSVVLFGESPTFRGYWLAPGRILTNALFYGLGKTGGREY
ncbi:peptidase M14 [Bacteroidia bacterium]|nr:peptidase M14 [Bacteroidia bacterium]